MKARLPHIDFADANPRWLPAHGPIGHLMNGASLLLPYLEPHLIRVMKLARPKLAERAPHLLEEVDVFNQQEANHYKVHAAYNEVLRSHYPGLEAFEEEIRSDYRDFIANRSIGWNLAYCEGFECMGLVLSEFFLQEIDDWLAVADPAVTELWQWHLAEEFEHRCVAHDVLHALHPGWWHRVQVFSYSQRHLFGFSQRVADHLVAIDRERGVQVEEAATTSREKTNERRLARFFLPRMARVLLPFYSPHPRPMQEPTKERLARYEAA